MSAIKNLELGLSDLCWRVDPVDLPYKSTDELEPLDEVIGQQRAVQALEFGIGMRRKGYNIFVTGSPDTGRMNVVKMMLKRKAHNGHIPNDLCYLHNFKNSEAPILLQLEAGQAINLKKEVRELVEALKREVPRLFESQEYIARKNEINESYDKKTSAFFLNLEKKVKEAGFALVQIQGRKSQMPEVMPMIDGEPTPLVKLEQMVEKGRFPEDEFANIKEKFQEIRKLIDSTFLEIREVQKEIQEKNKQADHLMFTNLASSLINPIQTKYNCSRLGNYFKGMVEDMLENLHIFISQGSQNQQMMAFMPTGDPFALYSVNVLVDNSEQQGLPVVFEDYPTYRNLFGSVERVVDRSGVWRTDFSKIKAGSFIKANGGYLVLNLIDAIVEPGVWQALKKALKSSKMEIQTYDPFYLFTTSGLKPEPIEMDIKVIVLADPYLYLLLQHYDQDTSKIFKVRADFDSSMNKDEQTMLGFARFVQSTIKENNLCVFSAPAVAVLLEQSVRMTGRQEKLSTSFPKLADLILEADYYARQNKHGQVLAEDVQEAVEGRIYRSSLIEEKIQEMIDRGSLFIDTQGAVVGQVNGLAVYSMGDYMFGKPSRITATTSMGKSGIINIEREADMSGNTHNKGVLILSGYLRKKFAQDKPLAVSASIAFEQSYGGVDGDSASSTEMYALLSSLSGVPLKQSIAVTGSVNQNGQIQPIGGVNQKIEGFFACCKQSGLDQQQGVMIPRANVKDLMLKKEVLEAVQQGLFHIWAISSIEEGIEILTGVEAGKLQGDGSYPEKSIFGQVDKSLHTLAEGLQKFGKDDKDKDACQ